MKLAVLLDHRKLGIKDGPLAAMACVCNAFDFLQHCLALLRVHIGEPRQQNFLRKPDMVVHTYEVCIPRRLWEEGGLASSVRTAWAA